MALVKLEDYYPNYREIYDYSDVDIKDFDVYVEGNEKAGTLSDILVDTNTGNFRYFVIDIGFWIFGKKVLLPIGCANVSYTNKRVYTFGLTKKQVEDLPNFDELQRVDYDYEEQVRDVYRASVISSGMTQGAIYDRGTYKYEQEPQLYNMNDLNNQTLKHYEERLIANKHSRRNF